MVKEPYLHIYSVCSLQNKPQRKLKYIFGSNFAYPIGRIEKSFAIERQLYLYLSNIDKSNLTSFEPYTSH